MQCILFFEPRISGVVVVAKEDGFLEYVNIDPLVRREDPVRFVASIQSQSIEPDQCFVNAASPIATGARDMASDIEARYEVSLITQQKEKLRSPLGRSFRNDRAVETYLTHSIISWSFKANAEECFSAVLSNEEGSMVANEALVQVGYKALLGSWARASEPFRFPGELSPEVTKDILASDGSVDDVDAALAQRQKLMNTYGVRIRNVEGSKKRSLEDVWWTR